MLDDPMYVAYPTKEAYAQQHPQQPQQTIHQHNSSCPSSWPYETPVIQAVPVASTARPTSPSFVIDVESVSTPCPCTRGSKETLVTTSSLSAMQVFWMLLLILVIWPLFWLPCVIPSCYSLETHCERCGREYA